MFDLFIMPSLDFPRVLSYLGLDYDDVVVFGQHYTTFQSYEITNLKTGLVHFK